MALRMSASCARRWADSAARRRRTTSSVVDVGVGSWGVDRREMRAGENCGGQRGGGARRGAHLDRGVWFLGVDELVRRLG